MDRCATGPRSFGAACWIPGVKTEKTAKKRRKNEQKWARYSHLKRVRAALLCLRNRYDVNGKPLHTSQYFSFGGQVATFVTNYLGAPVSLKEILDDMGQAGATLRPRSSHDGNANGDETQFRYLLRAILMSTYPHSF